jgi:integrase
MAKLVKNYPENTRVCPWILTQDGNKNSIRRWVYLPDGSKVFERFPAIRYQHIRNDLGELRNFVIRLNGFDPKVERLKKKVSFKHAFVSDELLADYEENYLSTHIPNKKDRTTLFAYLKNYGLNFFINKMQVSNPLEWHRNQHLWGKYLLNREDKNLDPSLRIFEPGDIRSAKVLKYTINELNRFMKYLHLKRPDEIPALTFEPLSKATLKEHDARRKMSSDTHQSKYIKPNDWNKIKKSLEAKNAPWRFAVYLAYFYGLRRNEALGLCLQDVRNAYLSVERQYVGLDKNGKPMYAPLKNRTSRKVPHLFLEPSEAYEFIELMQQHLMHPDTLSGNFTDLVSKLDIDSYIFHDLRRAFITNAIKKGVEPEDLRLAVGHSTIQTTYKFYVMDAREQDDQVWTPKRVA